MAYGSAGNGTTYGSVRRGAHVAGSGAWRTRTAAHALREKTRTAQRPRANVLSHFMPMPSVLQNAVEKENARERNQWGHGAARARPKELEENTTIVQQDATRKYTAET